MAIERTLAGETPQKIGQKVLLKGWVNRLREHGKLSFIDLRDRSGIVQIVIDLSELGSNSERGSGEKEPRSLRPEDVVEIAGTVVERDEKNVNSDIPTGTVEVKAEKVKILNTAETPPIDVYGDGYEIDEKLRLKYRYLDLRRPRLQKNLKLRSQYVQAAREYLFSKDFTEIETPILTKSTPEGSRDFIVPSRLQPGKFFALPQSPQQYKQLLMVAGFERYFQIARCLRDEDPRADRGFEHTQIDLEMSFVEREDVMRIVEKMTLHALKRLGAKVSQDTFPVFTYKEALEKFGSDKFDLRSKKEKENSVLSFAWVVDFPFFEKDKDGNWTFTHNPFSAPIPEHEQRLLKKQNIGEIITSQYDLICNGLEVAGGSIRTHKPEVLKAVFEILGYSDSETEQKFGHMLEAFKYGAPPHGGCAQGFERLLMAYLNEDYLREVQAFPQTGSGRTSVMNAPSEVDEAQLRELGIDVRPR